MNPEGAAEAIEVLRTRFSLSFRKKQPRSIEVGSDGADTSEVASGKALGVQVTQQQRLREQVDSTTCSITKHFMIALDN